MALQGEVVVRDGELHSEDDLVLQLSGWHVAATGRLHGILQPTSGAAQTALARHDIRNRTPAYRCRSCLCGSQFVTADVSSSSFMLLLDLVGMLPDTSLPVAGKLC